MDKASMMKGLGIFLVGAAVGAIVTPKAVSMIGNLLPKQPAPIVQVQENPVSHLPTLDETFAIVAVGYNSDRNQSQRAINSALTYSNEVRGRGAKVKLMLENPYNFPINANNEVPSASGILRAIRDIPSDKNDDIILYLSGDLQINNYKGLVFSHSEGSLNGSSILISPELDIALSNKEHRRIITIIEHPFTGVYGSQQKYNIPNVMRIQLPTDSSLERFVERYSEGLSTFESFKSVFSEYKSMGDNLTPGTTYYDPNGNWFRTGAGSRWNSYLKAEVVMPESLKEFVKENTTQLVKRN